MCKYWYKIVLPYLLLACLACGNNKPAAEEKSVQPVEADDTRNMDSVLLQRSAIVLQQLKEQRYEALAAWIHPVLGLRLSPYAHTDTLQDVHFSKAAFIAESRKPASQKRNWGYFDGSGEPIYLSFQGYFGRFVYDADFVNAPQKALNRTLCTGNTLQNTEAIYPGCNYTEHYFPGSGELYNGLDWKCLRLVYCMYGNEPMLTAIIHNQWTV